jgi:hypothetical protein
VGKPNNESGKQDLTTQSNVKSALRQILKTPLGPRLSPKATLDALAALY